MTLSSPTSEAGTLGHQRPRIQQLPAGASRLGPGAVRLCALAGLVLDPWQEYVLESSMREDARGNWSAFEVGLVVPRQQGKSAVLEGRAIVGLFAIPHERLIIWSAHLFKTAQEAFRRILNLIDTTPQLQAKVKRISTAHGSEGIELKDGSRILFMARTAGSARGFSADLIILDEAYALTDAMLAAIMPTLAAKSLNGNPQLIYASSAGMASSTVLAALRERATDGTPERLAYFEWSAPDDADLDDVETYAMANPGLGIRLSLSHVFSEREAMGDEEFKRERLGIWAKLGGESVIPPVVWQGLAKPDAQPGEQIVFAVDVSPSRDSASIGLASIVGDEVTHVEVIDNRVGTSWVGHRLGELAARWNPDAIVAVAGSNAESLIPAWKRDGVRVKLIRFPEYTQACGVLYDAIMQRRVVHLDDPVLNGALDGARQKWRADGATWYWDRKSDADITPLVAVTVAMAGLEKKRPRRATAGQMTRKALVL